MTIAIVLNAIFVGALLTLLAATMRLPFHLRSGEQIQPRVRRRRVRQPSTVGARRPAMRGARGQLASD